MALRPRWIPLFCIALVVAAATKNVSDDFYTAIRN